MSKSESVRVPVYKSLDLVETNCWPWIYASVRGCWRQRIHQTIHRLCRHPANMLSEWNFNRSQWATFGEKNGRCQAQSGSISCGLPTQLPTHRHGAVETQSDAWIRSAFIHTVGDANRQTDAHCVSSLRVTLWEKKRNSMLCVIKCENDECVNTWSNKRMPVRSQQETHEP